MAVVLVVGRSASARHTSPARARIAIAHGFCFVFRLQVACDFILRRHQCLCFSRGMVPVPMVVLRGLPVWHRVGGSTRRAAFTPSPSDTYFSLGSTINHLPSSHGDILACLLRDGTKPRCMQRKVHRALVVRAMLRVGCSVTAILSRRRSVLRPAILAPRPRCCRGGFLHTVVF